jgi:hypothetical protein
MRCFSGSEDAEELLYPVAGEEKPNHNSHQPIDWPGELAQNWSRDHLRVNLWEQGFARPRPLSGLCARFARGDFGRLHAQAGRAN